MLCSVFCMLSASVLCLWTFQFNYFNQSHMWNLYWVDLYSVDLSVKVFSVMKSQFNKQSMELSILWTLSKYFTDPKFMFTFDLISSSVESSITKKTMAEIACFLLFCSHFENELWRTPLCSHDIRFLFPYCTVPAVPQTRLNSACGTGDKPQVP